MNYELTIKRLRSLLKTIVRIFLLFILSALLALVIRLFLCNFYAVPSDSMEPAILPGDFILTDKWTYGARIFTRFQFDENSDPPMVRFSGFRKIRRNDVIVFNFPYRHNWGIIRMSLENIFVKRCIGLPGDSVSIEGGYYHIAGLSEVVGNRDEQKKLAVYQGELPKSIERTFPYDSVLNWNIRNFGPLYIPAVGKTIPLTLENFKLFHRMIVYETNADVQEKDSAVYINGELAMNYTFRSNWYFVAGDKVMNSQDSRYFGLIPEAYIIGRATIVLTSKDDYSGKRRWNRTLKRIEN